MKVALALGLTVAMTMCFGCTDDDDDPLADRGAQVQRALDVLVLDVGEHQFYVGGANDDGRWRDVERLHYTRTLTDLANVHRQVAELGGCANDSGQALETNALVQVRWAAQLVAAVHQQTMLVAPSHTDAMRVEGLYQAVMLDMVGEMRAELANVSNVAVHYTCSEYTFSPIESAPEHLLNETNAPLHARPLPPALHQEIYLDPARRANRLAPPPRWPVKPAPDWLLPEEVGPAVHRDISDAPDNLVPEKFAPERARIESAPATLTPSQVAPPAAAQEHPVVGPMLYDDPAPTEMAPEPLG